MKVQATVLTQQDTHLSELATVTGIQQQLKHHARSATAASPAHDSVGTTTYAIEEALPRAVGTRQASSLHELYKSQQDLLSWEQHVGERPSHRSGVSHVAGEQSAGNLGRPPAATGSLVVSGASSPGRLFHAGSGVVGGPSQASSAPVSRPESDSEGGYGTTPDRTSIQAMRQRVQALAGLVQKIQKPAH